ncbi:hypothetical protein HY605_05005 [Candidatus Peregrinibacteria bacterium]|nr:hypothetical protein [Candidatus Peregrinibacteria bacterium]
MERCSIEEFIKQKHGAKKRIAENLGFSIKKVLLGVVLDKELSGNEVSALIETLEGAYEIGVQAVILTDMQISGLPEGVKLLDYSRVNRKELLEASDMTLCFAFSDVEEMFLHGTIPISVVRKELADYNPNRETGNSFIYRKSHKWSMFAALVRALETFKFPYDWKNLVRQGLESVFGEEGR